MSTTKHAPGPFKVYEQGAGEFSIFAEDGTKMAECNAPWDLEKHGPSDVEGACARADQVCAALNFAYYASLVNAPGSTS